ncbi:MAG: EamA family transporter, partial [Saprospiraceae bacterium]|nr:EamA family transporter [Saprospiraceae bacterium]
IMILLTIIWGFSFILIKKSLVAVSPTQLASLRLAISSLTFSPLVYVYRKEIKWSDWKKFLAVGLTGSGIPAFLFFFAQTRISSSMAGLLNSLTPIWTLIISILLFGQPFHSKKMFGVLVGFAGASYLIFMGEHGIQGGAPLFASLVVFATLCYAMSVNMVQGFFGEVKPVIISSVSFFLLGPPAIIYLAFSDFPHVLVTHAVQRIAPGLSGWRKCRFRAYCRYDNHPFGSLYHKIELTMQQIPGLYIANSEGRGRGVFTTQNIEEGDIIEVCQIILIPKHQLPVIHKTKLHDYYFLWGEDLSECAIALGFGSLYNHETYPNANFILDLENETIDIFAIRQISEGEEITLNYHGEPGLADALWF